MLVSMTATAGTKAEAVPTASTMARARGKGQVMARAKEKARDGHQDGFKAARGKATAGEEEAKVRAKVLVRARVGVGSAADRISCHNVGSGKGGERMMKKKEITGASNAGVAHPQLPSSTSSSSSGDQVGVP